MSIALAYTVECEFADDAVASSFIAWLVDEHIADVCAAGALSAEVIRMDGSPPRSEVRYRFASRETFAVYERDHAPRLRALALEHGAREGRVRFRRSTGEIVGAWPPSVMRVTRV
jgi:hypothetical protein